MPQRVLIADDSVSMRTMLTATLRGAGFEVVEAVDGADALQKATGCPPSLIITDLNMPQLDGIELIRRLRAEPGFRATPILMLTTESQEARKQEGRKAGATGWIVKPFRPEQLLAVIKRVLG
jgi:two-component system chemotaxis response regulator CheY